MSGAQFCELKVKHTSPEAAGSIAITFDIPEVARKDFDFDPGQYLTLRAHINGREERRTYSISSPKSRLASSGEVEIGIRPIPGGVFSNWASQNVKAGDCLEVMRPSGQFVTKRAKAIHRVGFAAGSGITPILSIAATTLEERSDTKFTLVYGNKRTSTVMFNEALQDLKDRFPERFTLVHVFSQQEQESPLLEGRIDEHKVDALCKALLPAQSMDEVFVCGPADMIDSTERALLKLGVAEGRIRTERFFVGIPSDVRASEADNSSASEASTGKSVSLNVNIGGKNHRIEMRSSDNILDAAMSAGLDVPFSCKAGVCCTCKARITVGEAQMEKNFTLDAEEVARGFVLTCQARPTTDTISVDYDAY